MYLNLDLLYIIKKYIPLGLLVGFTIIKVKKSFQNIEMILIGQKFLFLIHKRNMILITGKLKCVKTLGPKRYFQLGKKV